MSSMRAIGWVRALMFAAVLLFAQSVALAHGAKFGFDSHMHDGRACEFALFSDRMGGQNLAQHTALPVPVVYPWIWQFVFQAFLIQTILAPNPPARAPPEFIVSI